MARGLFVLAAQARAPVFVHPLEMNRIDGVLLALEPVAGHFGEHDLAKAVFEGEGLPHRQFWRRLRAHIGPQEACELAHRVGGGGAALAAFRFGVGDVLVGLLQALPALIELPTVIEAADALLLDRAAGQIGAAVRAMARDEPETAAEVFVERQVLAEEPHRLDRVVVELAGAGDRHPVAPQQIAHRRARPDAGEHVIPGGGEHCD